MFKFLFGGKSTPEVTVETDRERFARLVGEINALIDGLAVKPRVTIDPETGHILPEAPEQFPDEALALPAPPMRAGEGGVDAPAAEAVADAAGPEPKSGPEPKAG